jgi:nucleotide-binding universal stress UspA family protein
MSTSRKPVVDGIDGSESALRAVRYGVVQAQLLDTSVELVHVTPTYVPMPATRPVVPPSFRETGRSVLRTASSVAGYAAPGRPVHTTLISGSRTTSLLAASQSAAMVVLGTEHRSRRKQIVTGGTIEGVAARARCPVVVVPPEWGDVRPQGRVVVGCKSTRHISGLLQAGFAAAATVGAALVVMHAWRMAGVYDDIIESRFDLGDWRERTARMFEPMIDELRPLYPEVRVRTEVLHAQPARALVDASADADLMLVGRPAHGPAFGHLGATARAVLRHAQCPVEVLAAVNIPPVTADLVLEEGGTLIPFAAHSEVQTPTPSQRPKTDGSATI